MSNENIEQLVIEIISEGVKNVVISTHYRPPTGDIKMFKNYIKSLIETINRENKEIYKIGDMKINSLDYSSNNKVKSLINILFKNGFIPTINKPTRVTCNSLTIIDHIFINNFIDHEINPGIIKTDISDHFPIFIINKKITMKY